MLMLTASFSGCSRSQATPSAASDLKPVMTVKELMENIIDPQADVVFDAVTVDVTAKGIIEVKPTSDDDWVKVQRGAIILLESSNLLKMPRRIAPPGDKNNSEGANAPELSPEAIQVKVDNDRALWNTHADQLREEALKVLDIVKSRDADQLLTAGSDIDRACENCHLEYWYPGDKLAVERDRNSRATYGSTSK